MPGAVDRELHRWAIAEREYRRHEIRRGRRHAYESLVGERTALVVIDMVPFFIVGNAFTRGIVPNIVTLAGAVRGSGGTVAYVVPSSDLPVNEAFLGPEVADLYRISGGSGSIAGRLCDELDTDPDDPLVEKSAPSAFFPGRCDLPARLVDLGIDTVLIAGTAANVCCESSARDASTLGYRVIMVADANAAPTDAELNATLHTVYRSFGDVRTTDDLIALLQP